MALKIRLRQQGRKNRTVYRVVVADVRSPRDGKYVEAIGWYNPIESLPEKNLFLNTSRMQFWLDRGAQLTESVEALVAASAPDVLRKLTEKALAKRAKEHAKRKARKKVAA
jgi:small subunit ribosomal protein S16